MLPTTAQAGYTGGSGSGWAQCGNFYASSSTQVYFWWDSYVYVPPDQWGNLVQPFQGLILLNDPNHYISSACGPMSWTNQVTFSNTATSYVPNGGTCWAFQYDVANSYGRWGCNRTGYFYSYDGTYGSAWWGATIYPYSAFVGAFNGQTPWFAL